MNGLAVATCMVCGESGHPSSQCKTLCDPLKDGFQSGGGGGGSHSHGDDDDESVGACYLRSISFTTSRNPVVSLKNSIRCHE
jgi:hypothetical protein